MRATHPGRVSILCALLGAAPVGAQTLVDATAAFERGDFAAALVSASAVAKEAADPATVARAHLMEARCLYALRKPTPLIEAALDAALSAAPEVDYDAAETAPRLVSMLAAKRVAASGRLTITSEPPGLPILIDGVLVGTTPLEQRVVVGSHRVEVSLPGRPPEAREVSVGPGQLVGVRLTGFEVGPPLADAGTAEPPRAIPESAPAPVPVSIVVGVAGVTDVLSFGRRANLGLQTTVDVQLGRVGFVGLVVNPVATSVGLGLRGGARWWFIAERLGLEASGNASLYLAFSGPVTGGVGASVSVVGRLLSWLELIASVGPRWILPVQGSAPWYLLVEAGLRVRFEVVKEP